MNPDSIQNALSTALITIALIGAASFVWQYNRHFAWKSSLPGRTLMRAKLSLILVMTYLVVGRWLQFDQETRDWVSIIVFAPLAFVQVALSIAIYRHRKNIDRDRLTTEKETELHG